MQSFRRFVFAFLIIAPLGARAQEPAGAQQVTAYWRNFRRAHAAYAVDSEPCATNARTVAVGTQARDQAVLFQNCMVEHGWLPMRMLSDAPNCAPVALHPAGADSAANAAFFAELTSTLERLYRPFTPEDTAASIVLRIDDTDIDTRAAGIYEVHMPHAVQLAVTVARSELHDFATHVPFGKMAEVTARFEPKCVSEFPIIAAEKPSAPAYFEFQVEKVVRPLINTPPKYPPSLESEGINGRVLVQFVVDTLGRVELHTFKVLESSDPLFTAAVHESLPSMRFRPATIKGRKVRQVVQQPFTFAIR